ncbi:DUF5979 domain-containing protein [Microbacterium sp. B2969]|uniref:DUF5979 domain-containing protein n=1 Tax=Microbacterium alkaliflavum TaxID=3248839 RepID=A0ABW7QA60_9MICO
MLRIRRAIVAGVVAALVASVVVPGTAMALADPDPAAVTAVASLTKDASVDTVEPGETFTYTLTIGCSSITDTGCRDAVVSDTVPAPFVLVSAAIGPGVNSAAPPVIDGNSVTVDWTTPLGDGTTGILDASTAVVELTAQLPAGASYDANGVPVVNNAVIEGTNFVDVDAEAPVTPVIPLGLATTATKSFSPSSLIASPGAPVTASLGGSNDSNATVTSLVIQDPGDPDASPNPFTLAGFAGFGTVTAPAGTTATTYEVYVDGAWVVAPGGVLPSGVDPADVRGTRVTFTGEIPAGATASVDLDLELTELATTQTDGTTVGNDVTSTVGRDGQTASDDAAAGLVLRQNSVTVGASKQFDPEVVVAGESSNVTIGGSNTSAIPIESLTITEPAVGSFPADYTFAGITGPVTYPAGATSGEVTYHFTDGTTETVIFASGTTPPPPATHALDEVASFEVHFEGDIAVGGETTVPFQVDTDPDAAGLPATVPNEVGVRGENLGNTGTSTASDDLYIYSEQIQTYVDKSIRPSQILGVPGEVVTVSLQGGLTDRPNPPDVPDGSTGNASQIVIQDPEDPIEGDAWWNAFDITAITQTPVPAGSTLTIEYYDTTTGTWEVLTSDIAGPTIYSAPVPSDVSAVAGGIRFVYDDTTGEGFPPGTDLAPNFTSELRAEGRYTPGPPFSDTDSTFVPDCAQSGASSINPVVPDAGTAMPAADCPEIEIIPPDPGNADLIDKAFGTSSSGGIKSVIARSGDTIPSTLSWSTGGYSNLGHVDITDAADSETAPVTATIYDSFNLIGIGAITALTDPLMIYDQVQQVQIWNGTAWIDAPGDPCPAACVGTFPGMTFNLAQRETIQGVRLIFVESPNRAAVSAGVVDAPPVGSGVARSFTNDRLITLNWTIRDDRRSDGTAVLGDELYNLAQAGVVRNTANAAGYPASGDDPITSDAQDDVTIIDVPLTTTTSKTWSGGPVSPPPGSDVPANQYPTTRMSVTTRNTTPAKVDQLVITDPVGVTADRRTDPFQAFSFTRFVAINVPAGADTTLVTLSCPDGSSFDYDLGGALDLTEATLPCDVSGVRAQFDGRIVSNGAGTLIFDMRLRQYWRGTTERVTIADTPISNTAQGGIADVDPLGPCPPPQIARYACDQDTATMTIADAVFGVDATKSITPDAQKENVFDPVTVTITGQPTGTIRTQQLTLVDDDASFWNAFDFQGMSPGWHLTSPVDYVEACYLDGGDFTAANVTADDVGGTWTCQPAGGDGTIATASAFLASAPPTLHGLRFTFRQANNLGWQNPANPLLEVPFLVVRRDTLRSGGTTPTTRSDQVIPPGETELGTYTNTVTAGSVSTVLAGGIPVTATDSADAQYRNLHLEVAINVTKTPNGDVQPGIAIPYTLSFTNTGELPLLDPIFRDRLPTDAQGPQLILDPDRDPSVPPWSFALSGAAPVPPNGPALPTDPDLVDVSEADDVITFTMPPGSVLEPSQTYTITILLMLRPGLTPDDQVTNVAAIAVDVPLDACVPTFDQETGECTDSSTVQPLAVPALSTVKKVKADTPVDQPGIPEVFSTANDFSCADQADAQGFYRSPCIPVTLPGDTETWRFSITNAGTVPVDKIVSIDNLPTPGDQGLIVVLPRESEWQPTFADGIQLLDAPPGATLATFGSTSSVPCTADLNPVGTPCAIGAWLPLAAMDPANVRSIKFVVDFPDGDRFVPGEVISLQYQTRTTPTAVVADPYPIAYNTVSTGGEAVGATAPIAVPATEGRRVGVSYPTGPIQLEKIVSGPAAQYAPDSFPVQLTCTSGGTPLTGIPSSVLVPGADPVEIAGLPWGAECTATEGENGQSSVVIGTATVGGPDDEIGLVSIENVFDVGDLDITKVVDSDAVDANGDPVEYGPFDFAVDCTFLGSAVFAEGYDDQNPMAATLGDGETWSLSGLPIGAECTVTETDTDGAASTQIVVTQDGTAGDPIDGTSAEVTIGAQSGVLVTATNFFGAGDLTLVKVVDGEAGPDFGAGPFRLHVECTLDDSTVWDGDVMLGGDDPLEATIDDIAAGAECTVTEPDDAGATNSVIDPGTVTIGDGQVVTVTVTNTFTAASLRVSKVIDGEGAELYGAGPFEVTLTCLQGLTPVDIPGGATRELSAGNGYTTTYAPLLIGLVCRIAETDDGGATSSTITDADGNDVGLFTIDPEGTLDLTVTNTFDVGSLEVVKSVSGTDAAAHAADEFEVTAACTFDGAAIDIPDGAVRTLTVAAPVVYEDLPVGAECTVAETDAGGADAVTLSPADPADPSRALVTVGADAVASITVDNRFDAPLPVTGGDLGRTALAAMLGLLLLGGGVLVVLRRRRA